MKTALVLLALLFPLLAQAGVVVVADGPNGSQIRLYDDTGPCVNGARRAEWVSADQKERIAGCWISNGGGVVHLAFMDGDAVRAPLAAFQPPKTL